MMKTLVLPAATIFLFALTANAVEPNPAKRLGYSMAAHAGACALRNQASEYTGPTGESVDASSTRRFAVAKECVEKALDEVKASYKRTYDVSGESKQRVEELYASWIQWMEALRSYLPSTRKVELERAFQEDFAALRADVDRR